MFIFFFGKNYFLAFCSFNYKKSIFEKWLHLYHCHEKYKSRRWREKNTQSIIQKLKKLYIKYGRGPQGFFVCLFVSK